jgi:hypothetical protein
MTKRWMNFPRIAMCGLTMASVVALGLNAYAGTLRNAGSRTNSTGSAVHATFGPQTAFNPSAVNPATDTPAPPPVTFFSVMGSGLSTYGDSVGSNPQSDCTNAGFPIGSDDGNCVEATGAISDGSGSFTSGVYSVLLNVDQSSAFNNGSGLDCFAASGEVLLPKGTGGIQGVARLLTSGIACVTSNGASAAYEAGFSITGSTGIFAGAQGTGVVSFSIDNLSTTDGVNFQSFLYVTGAQAGL